MIVVIRGEEYELTEPEFRRYERLVTAGVDAEQAVGMASGRFVDLEPPPSEEPATA